MTCLIAVENLKIEEIASQFCIQIFIELGYFLHFLVTHIGVSSHYFMPMSIACHIS